MFRTITKPQGEAGPVFNQLLCAVVGVSAGNGGFTPHDVRVACKILDKIDAADDKTIAITEAEYSFIKNRLSGFQFTQAGKPLVEFLDAIDNARAHDTPPD